MLYHQNLFTISKQEFEKLKINGNFRVVKYLFFGGASFC